MRVGVIGASGYTGGELLRYLSMHRECEVVCATSRRYAGKSVELVHPNLRGVLNLLFEDLAPPEVADRCEFVFTATPHGASMQIVPELLDAGVRVVDLSGDFRFSDVAVYEEYYGVEHAHPEVKAVYGLPELYREDIKSARVVANPGCYPTSVILGLLPMVKEGIIETDRIAADSKSGVSGAGSEPKPATHFCMVEESITPYLLTRHRHLPEMEQALRELDDSLRISFVPHLVPVIRGISTTLHCFLREDVSGEELREIYAEHYGGEAFVRVLEAGAVPRMSAVRGTNYLDIGGFGVDRERGRAIVVSVIDNLGKGAAGQAVQNMNLMMGFPETTGLQHAGLHP
jgi:N-acetyl-gamma-glutamyl-phosphate reductase